jgi:hypothetical protein
LAADGWKEIDLELEQPETLLEGIGFRLMHSPDRQILLTANWRATGASTSIVRLQPVDPRAALWHAEAVNLPVEVLLATTRAATGTHTGPGPMMRLRAAGWQQQPVIEIDGGIKALRFIDPAGQRWAAAQHFHHHGRRERGPWMISRDDLEPGDGLRAYAHTDAGAPGCVIAALALTRAEPSA